MKVSGFVRFSSMVVIAAIGLPCWQRVFKRSSGQARLRRTEFSPSTAAPILTASSGTGHSSIQRQDRGAAPTASPSIPTAGPCGPSTMLTRDDPGLCRQPREPGPPFR